MLTFFEDGTALFRQACAICPEGVISKRREAPYRSGRIRDWVKTKCSLRQEFVVAANQLEWRRVLYDTSIEPGATCPNNQRGPSTLRPAINFPVGHLRYFFESRVLLRSALILWAAIEGDRHRQEDLLVDSAATLLTESWKTLGAV